jgi:hypothetical protein
MRLENMAVALRPRSGWEAIDLGYAMAQQWWVPLMKAWCAVYLLAAILINLACWKMPVLAVFILWWLKPAFDRVVLHVLAGAVFGATPTLRETLGALKRLWWHNALFAGLTYARFNLARSFTLPVLQLEGSRGKRASKRRALLGREGHGTAVWLTLIGLHIEATMYFSIFILLAMLTPGDATGSFGLETLFNTEPGRIEQYATNAISVLVISILEPFYVAGGFAIYLNSRTAIEGWDVELAFKRMSARIAAGNSVTGGTAVRPARTLRRTAVLLLMAGAIMLAVPLQNNVLAQTTAEQSAGSDAVEHDARTTDGDEMRDALNGEAGITPETGAAEAAGRVLEHKEFGEYEQSWKIKYVGPEWGKQKKKKPTDAKWLASVAEFIAASARVIAWIGGGSLVLFLVYLIARHIGVNGWQRGNGSDFPDILFGLDVRPESLPENVPAAAQRLLAAGDVRGAVSLMYRGALVSLIQDGRIDIARGDTELECVARVRSIYRGNHSDAGANPENAKANYFAIMVSIWQRVAYAKKSVAAAEVTPLIDQWSSHFAIRRQAGETNGAAKAAVAQVA